jgi:hypothetical protein
VPLVRPRLSRRFQFSRLLRTSRANCSTSSKRRVASRRVRTANRSTTMFSATNTKIASRRMSSTPGLRKPSLAKSTSPPPSKHRARSLTLCPGRATLFAARAAGTSYCQSPLWRENPRPPGCAKTAPLRPIRLGTPPATRRAKNAWVARGESSHAIAAGLPSASTCGPAASRTIRRGISRLFAASSRGHPEPPNALRSGRRSRGRCGCARRRTAFRPE